MKKASKKVGPLFYIRHPLPRKGHSFYIEVKALEDYPVMEPLLIPRKMISWLHDPDKKTCEDSPVPTE